MREVRARLWYERLSGGVASPWHNRAAIVLFPLPPPYFGLIMPDVRPVPWGGSRVGVHTHHHGTQPPYRAMNDPPRFPSAKDDIRKVKGST